VIEQLGNKRYGIPVVVLALVACVMALVIYPMVTAEPKNMPFGILSQDQNAETPQGVMNLGKDIVETILDSSAALDEEDGEVAVAWTEYASRAELDAALADQAIYAAIVVPEDFTAAQVEARTEAAEARGQVLAEQLPALMADPQSLA
jgi:uncharacterized phage infection (PIP) family protein YhgE